MGWDDDDRRLLPGGVAAWMRPHHSPAAVGAVAAVDGVEGVSGVCCWSCRGFHPHHPHLLGARKRQVGLTVFG